MKTYIWSLPTRFFHWLMFIGLVSAYFLGGEDNNLNLHTAFGYMVIVLILFRIIWGFVGPKYSRFTDFPIGISKIQEFFKDMNASKKKHIGHNPAASLVMLAILAIVLCIGLTGLLTLASEGQGPLSFLNLSENEAYKELHEVFVNILIVLVILHLLGLIVDKALHGDNGTLFSMFTGRKTLEGESIKLGGGQKILSSIFIVLALAAFFWGSTMQNLKSDEGDEHKGNKELKINNDDD